MTIELQDQYKSLRPFRSEEISDLTIITGKNGSGKSQLLNLLGQTLMGNSNYSQFRLSFSLPIKSVQFEGVNVDASRSLSKSEITAIINQHMGDFRGLSQVSKEIIELAIEKELDLSNKQVIEMELVIIDEFLPLIQRLRSERRNYLDHESILRKIFIVNSGLLFEIIKEIRKITKKKVIAIEDMDFHTTQYPEHLIDSNSLFDSRFEVIFYNYAQRRYQNHLKYFAKKEYSLENDSVRDDVFEAMHSPPWNIINEMFKENGFDYSFKELSPLNFAAEVYYTFDLIKNSTGETIPFNDLSSGEKTILGLTLKLFTSEYYNNSLEFPEMLILDEPDAHLHPEMSKLLLDVLNKTFVKKLGMKVIISTHSPSTIAVAPEDSIYQMANTPQTFLKKISKDDALKLLTGFIPTLSIDYQNHRQVFVESPTDVKYYQYLFDGHNETEKLNHRLYFISNAMGKGNCDLVYSIVEKIRASGNRTSFGVVDWDTKNKASEFVKVHGINERYSIENFLLDPVYVLCLLVENRMEYINEKLNIDITYNYYNIPKDTSKLKKHCEIYFQILETKFPNLKTKTDKKSTIYHDGVVLELPSWYLTMKGHDLVEKIKECFPALSKKYPTQPELLDALAVIMAKFYPFVPKNSISLIEELAN